MVDYYKTIKIVDFHNIMASIMNSLSGAISIQANVGLVQAGDATKFELILQRILGLCFDSKKEIDVSGVAKVAELDGVDDSFFEFTEIDLRNIDDKEEVKSSDSKVFFKENVFAVNGFCKYLWVSRFVTLEFLKFY